MYTKVPLTNLRFGHEQFGIWQLTQGEHYKFLGNFSRVRSQLTNIIPDELQEKAFGIFITFLYKRCEDKSKRNNASHKIRKFKFIFN